MEGLFVIKSAGSVQVHSRPSCPFVLTMNPPPQVSINWFGFTILDLNQLTQVGSHVRWWNSQGVLMTGSVRAINVLSDVHPFIYYTLYQC